MNHALAAASTKKFVTWSEDGSQLGRGTLASMAHQQQAPCAAPSSTPNGKHAEAAPHTAHALAEYGTHILYQDSNSIRSSSAGNVSMPSSTESGINTEPVTLSMAVTLSRSQDASQQGNLECGSAPDYKELPSVQQAQAKQLVAPALSLDGTTWPRMAATEAETPRVPSQQETMADAGAAAGARSFTVPPLRLSNSTGTAATAARASLFELEASLPIVDLLGSSNPSSPAQVARAHAPAQHSTLVLENPWTQNTARALRRAQQEVRELCTAQGLPLPAERPYCFDVVGIRAAGYGSSNSRPIASCGASSTPGAGKNNSCGSPGGSASGATSSAGVITSCGSTSNTNGACPAAAVTASTLQSMPIPESGSIGNLPSPVTPVAAPAEPDLLQQLKQRRGQTLLGQLKQQQQQWEEEQQQTAQQLLLKGMHPRSAGALVKSATCWDETWPWQHQQLQRGAEQRQQYASCKWNQVPYELQQQVWQASLRPKSAAAAAVKANDAWCDTWPWQRQQQQQQQRRRPQSSRGVPVGGQVSRKADGINVDDLLKRADRSLAVHEQHLSKDAAARVHSGGLSYQLPERWWAIDTTALSDPLLLQMPVWMRQAIELELVP